MKKRLVVVAMLLLPAVSYADGVGVGGWMNEIQKSMFAFKVMIKQMSISSDKSLAVSKQSTSAQQSAKLEQYNQAAVSQTMATYGPDGQLVDPCYQVGVGNMSASTSNKTAQSAMSKMSQLYRVSSSGTANSGGLTGALGATDKVSSYPFAASVYLQMQRHLAKYCSVSEAASGYCTLTPNGMQAADSDFSVHLRPGETFGWDQSEAATDYVKTFAPMTPVPNANKCTSPECNSSLTMNRVAEVFMSIARFSMMRMIEAHITQKIGLAKEL